MPLAVLIALGLAFYALGAPTPRRQADVLLAEAPAPAGVVAYGSGTGGRLPMLLQLRRVATMSDRPAITRRISYAAAKRGAGRRTFWFSTYRAWRFS